MERQLSRPIVKIYHLAEPFPFPFFLFRSTTKTKVNYRSIERNLNKVLYTYVLKKRLQLLLKKKRGGRGRGVERRSFPSLSAMRRRGRSFDSVTRQQRESKLEEKEGGGKGSAYPKTPRTIYHAQRAQQEVRLGMLMWAAGAGSQCACATPRGANHRPRNGSCARSQLVGHHNLAKMEEE